VFPCAMFSPVYCLASPMLLRNYSVTWFSCPTCPPLFAPYFFFLCLQSLFFARFFILIKTFKPINLHRVRHLPFSISHHWTFHPSATVLIQHAHSRYIRQQGTDMRDFTCGWTMWTTMSQISRRFSRPASISLLACGRLRSWGILASGIFCIPSWGA